MRSERFHVIGNAPGWSCILRETDRFSLEVHHSMPNPPETLGCVLSSKDGYRLSGLDFAYLRGKNAHDLARKAWISWAKKQGLSEITINRYPAHPETFVF